MKHFNFWSTKTPLKETVFVSAAVADIINGIGWMPEGRMLEADAAAPYSAPVPSGLT